MAGSRNSAIGLAAEVWGWVGVVYILTNPIKRLLPLALLPFEPGAVAPHALDASGWVAYACFVAFMAYLEGYKGFQRKFAPMVVARAHTLAEGPSPSNGGVLAWLPKAFFAPFYSMGLFHATKKRLLVSWGMVVGISTVVAACKRVPYPWRSVVDGGVVVGLSWGAASVTVLAIKAVLAGAPPAHVSAHLPE